MICFSGIDRPVRIEPVEHTVVVSKQGAKRSCKLRQFLVTLAYAITDYKCQGKTYENQILLDLKRPVTGKSPAAFAYIQLSRER